MKKPTAHKKIYAFIDSQNLNLGVRSAGWKLDFKKFANYLRTKYRVAKLYLFIGYVGGNEKLYTFLQSAGYILIFKPTLMIKKGKNSIVKGNVDAELVLHTMIQLDNFNKAIIVSGDGDFHCLIEYLDDNDKLDKILVPNKKFSSLLRRFSSKIINVQVFRKRLEK